MGYASYGITYLVLGLCAALNRHVNDAPRIPMGAQISEGSPVVIWGTPDAGKARTR